MQFRVLPHPIGTNKNKMKNNISIPKPCHENWETMLPEEQGRHCLSCCKTVIDFSTWDNESIMVYLQQRNSERVCGRFNTEQLAQPVAPQQALLQQVVQARMPFLRKIAAIIVLCFGLSGMNNEAQAQKLLGKVAVPKHPVEQTTGEIAIQPATDTLKPQPVPVVDTTKPMIMGMIAPYHPPKQKTPKPTKVSKQAKVAKPAKAAEVPPAKR